MTLRIPGYALGALIGEGGGAEVYRARQLAVDADVAMKVMRGSLAPDDRRRAQAERRALGQLRGHPHIVTVLDAGVADGRDWVAMELLSGGSLDHLLAEHGPLPAPRVARIGAAIASALEAAHSLQMAHRDVKPANILLDVNGVPKLADFGIVRDTSSSLMTAGAMTIAYASPEAFSGRPVDGAADVYSLCLTLHELLTGEQPFIRATDSSPAALINRIVTEGPPRLGPEQVPSAEYADTIAAGLVADPDERISIAELRRRLDALGRAEPQRAPDTQILPPPEVAAVRQQPDGGRGSDDDGTTRETRPVPGGRRALAVIGVVALLAAVGAGALLIRGGGRDEPAVAIAPAPGPAVTETAGRGERASLEGIDLSGVELTVGSKDFVEQLILGELYVQGLQAVGATVTNRVGTGTTSVTRDALLSGEIDVYPEYNGTGWITHLGNADPDATPQELTEMVRAADQQANGIVWVGRTPFSTTYGVAAGPAFVREFGELDLPRLASHLADNPGATLCVDSDFASAAQGLPRFEEQTGFQVPGTQLVVRELTEVYERTASGDCTFGEVFTTDSRIASLDLDVLEDPGVFIPYNISATLREADHRPIAAELDQLFDALHAPLDNATMTELNQQALEGRPPADVARDFLQAEGLI